MADGIQPLTRPPTDPDPDAERATGTMLHDILEAEIIDRCATLAATICTRDGGEKVTGVELRGSTVWASMEPARKLAAIDSIIWTLCDLAREIEAEAAPAASAPRKPPFLALPAKISILSPEYEAHAGRHGLKVAVLFEHGDDVGMLREGGLAGGSAQDLARFVRRAIAGMLEDIAEEVR